MNIEKHNKILGLSWLMIGGGNTAILTMKLCQALAASGSEIFDSALHAYLIGIVISFLTFLSGWALFKRQRWGRVAISIISLIYVGYNFLYFSFHGAEEEGTITTIIVLCLLVLGLYSIFFLLAAKS